MRKRLIKFLKKILGIKSPSCMTIRSRFYCRGKNDFCTAEQKNEELLQRLRVLRRQRRRMEGRGMKKRTPEEKARKEAVAKGLQAVVAAFQRLMETLTPICKELSEIIELYPNKRVVHLAKHARKERVRKKNINRILKWYARGGH